MPRPPVGDAAAVLPRGPRRAAPGAPAVSAGSPAAAGRRVVRFLAAIAFLCGGVSFAGSSVFDIRSVSVAGNRAVPAPEILARAGVRTGTSLFTVNAERIRDRLAQDPRIAEVSVGVAFPDHVYITVRERTAAAALRVPGGYVLLGSDGVAIAPSGTPGPLPTLRVDGLDPAEVQAGIVVPSPDARFGAEVAASLPEVLRPDVAALRVDGAGEVVLYTRDGIAVRAGAPDGIRDRLARVADVLAAVRSRGMRVEYVDLRFPGSVIVKPIGGPAGPAGRPG
ncbi:MAG TPA: FtsQ-type POTRA domain-containing protein [bacterium]|nr:FtsQ-type POTRA domain-containing protein [bacterium]